VLFDSINQRRLSDDECFLCGTTLMQVNRSSEHVIPRWAQERFDLWDQRLVLLNGTAIPYRYLTVPCCKACNEGALQPLETLMAEATLRGADAVRDLDPMIVFTWLGKVFYGLMHRELFLLLNRQAPDEGSIASPDLIKRFSLHHMFLQNIRLPMMFENGCPGSLFVNEAKEPPDRRHGWDLRDHLPDLFIAVRIGQVSIVAALQDGGEHEGLRAHLESLLPPVLHPLQHLELAAKVCYKLSLRTSVPSFLVVEGEEAPVQVIHAPQSGLSGTAGFAPWDQETYASLLAFFTGCPRERLLHPGGRVTTWLRNDDGNPCDLDFDAQPWPPFRASL
jgi:hypothetical protein